MIECIISSGDSGSAMAALDVAIKLGLDHRGWRRSDDSVPEKYRIEPIPEASYQTIVEKSIGIADGSLCFSKTMPIPLRLETVKKVALRLNKPFLSLSLDQENGFLASRRIAVWIVDNRIRRLHVAGEDKATDGSTDRSAAKIIEAALFLCMMETGLTSPLQSVLHRERSAEKTRPPHNIEAALDHLERTLSLKDRALIANMTADELVSLLFSLGDYINHHFGMYTTNSQLLGECRRISDNSELAPDEAAAVIIRLLWERLQAMYRIRVVK